jgi:aspartate-semialdehyde dehydrogenase
MEKLSRGVIVGASTLLGKELAEELSTAQPAWDLHLADASDAEGQIVAAGDEPLLVQPLRPESFGHGDVVFFADEVATTRTHWMEAKKAGASVVDLTAGIEGESGVLMRSPWVDGGPSPDVKTTAVVPAHPAAVMMGVVTTRLRARFGKVRIAATVLEPASQQGSRGLDEMHQQTVDLLGFHALPQEVYDAQVAFNLRVSVGESARLNLSAIAATIRRHLAVIAGEAASLVTMQLVQAPVFHGYTMSVFVNLSEPVEPDAVRKALHGGVVQVLEHGGESPSNQSVTQSGEIQIAVSEEPNMAAEGRGYWLWMAADNLRLAARHAVACAIELGELRTAI